VSEKRYGVLHVGLRRTVLSALRGSPALELTESASDADLVLVDACSFTHDDMLADLAARVGHRPLPRVVLSVTHAGEAPPPSFPAQVAAREAAAVSGVSEWCVLWCAAFGQELAWNCRYETAGALYTAWQPEGAPWVDASDVFDLIEKLMTSHNRKAAYEVTGPAVVPMTQACETLRALHDRPMLYVRLEEDVLCSAMEQVGVDIAHAARSASYMVWTTSDTCRTVSPVLEQALGRTPRALEDYLLTTARSYLAMSA
jgi:hypothetical protein